MSQPIKVFVNGCFDVLHPGHLKLLEFAASIGDWLVVAIDTDERIKETKGSNRPIHNQKDRMYQLSRVAGVNKVEIFDSKKQLEQLVQEYSPDLMVVGSEYSDKEVVGAKFAKAIAFFDIIPGYSTSNIVNNIQNVETWKKLTYCFDIDETICTKTMDGTYNDCRPIQKRIDEVNALHNAGHNIIFNTARGMRRNDNNVDDASDQFYNITQDQLWKWRVNYSRLFMGKPASDVIVDDKAVSDKDFFQK